MLPTRTLLFVFFALGLLAAPRPAAAQGGVSFYLPGVASLVG